MCVIFWDIKNENNIKADEARVELLVCSLIAYRKL